MKAYLAARIGFDDDPDAINQAEAEEIIDVVERQWSKDSELASVVDYLNGKLHGKCLLWNEKGQKTLEAYFENGKHHGPYTSWWDNGNRKEEGVYENGERVGKYYWYSEYGDLLSEHDYST